MKDIEIKSAFYTTVVCLVIFLVMLFYKLTIEPKESVKFNEVIFAQSFEEIKQDESPAQLKAGRGLKTSIAIKTTNLPRINLPTRFTISGEEIIPSEKFAEKSAILKNLGKSPELEQDTKVSLKMQVWAKRLNQSLALLREGKQVLERSKEILALD
jgi:hypothetical protein